MTATFIEEYKGFLLYQKDKGGEFGHFFIARKKEFLNDEDGGKVFANGVDIENVKENVDKYLRQVDYDKQKEEEEKEKNRKSLIRSIQYHFSKDNDETSAYIAAVDIQDNNVTCYVWASSINYTSLSYLKGEINNRVKECGFHGPVKDIRIGYCSLFEPNGFVYPSFEEATALYFGDEKEEYRKLYEAEKPLFISISLSWRG